MVATFLGATTESTTVFLVALALLIAVSVHDGSIRPKRRNPP